MIQALRGLQGLQEPLERQAQCQDLQVQQALRVQTVQLETQGQPVLPATLDLLVQQEPTALLVQLDQLVQLEILVQQVRQVIQVLLDLLVLMVLLVQQDRRDQQDLQVLTHLSYSAYLC